MLEEKNNNTTPSLQNKKTTLEYGIWNSTEIEYEKILHFCTIILKEKSITFYELIICNFY